MPMIVLYFCTQRRACISEKLGSVLKQCSEWLVDNKLSLHLGKTECILFGPKRKVKEGQDFIVTCNNHIIKAFDHVKYLGVIIDNHLSGELIVDSIVHQVNNRLKFLYRQAKLLDVKCKMSLCSALITCHMDYACSSWYSGLTNTLRKKLQVCQNKVVRFILDLPPMLYINYSVLSSLNLLNVEDRVAQLRLNLVYNIYQGKAPSYLSEHFLLRSETSRRNTRSCSNLDYIVPRIKTCESGSFFHQGIQNWNELPRHI